MKQLSLIFIGIFLMAVPAQGYDGADTSISSTGDVEAGRLVFQKCGGCHRIKDNGPPLVGPNLDNIFGRMAGTSGSYSLYSKALRESGIVWSETELDKWLADPANYLPGNKMPFAGLRSAEDRANLIAYLRANSGGN